nr:photosystem I subunit II [Cyanidium caldarium]
MQQSLNLKMPSPEFYGNTGGWLRSSDIEEKYAITWSSKNEDIFEIPTGGVAKMKAGDNLLYLAKKEQCLALGNQLKIKFKILNFKIYRIFPDGEAQFLHPKDGVFPEKVNEGRKPIGKIDHNIGKNLNPAEVKFTHKTIF